MLRFVTRPLRFILEFLAAVLGVAVVAGVLLIWRLSVSPISSSFLTPYIEAAIVRLVPGTQVTIAHSLLTWDNADHSITLHADSIHLAGVNGAAIADVPDLDIRVSALGLFLGRLVPAALVIEQPHVWLVRSKDGDLVFGGMTAQGGGNFRNTLTRVADELTHAHFTRKLQIGEAVFDVHDEGSGANWSVNIQNTLLERHLDGDLTGEAKIEVTQQNHTQLISVHYKHDAGEERHEITARFSAINPAFLAAANPQAAIFNLPLTGEIDLGFDNDFRLMTEHAELHGDAGTLDYKNFWDAPRAVSSLDLQADYDRKTGALDIAKADIDFGGPKLAMTLAGARAPADATPPRDLDFSLTVKLTNLPMNDFGVLWPKPVVPDARAWMADSLSKGKFDRADAVFKGNLKWNDLDDLQITEGKGTIIASGAQIKYLDDAPPAVGVNAAADFDLNKMTITISGGGIGDLKLQPSTIQLTDFEKDTQNIDLPLHLVGPLSSVLKLIDAPRFRYASAVGLVPDSINGSIDGTLEMKFPLINALMVKDIDIKANAQITDLSSSKLISGLDITQGDLALDLDKNGLNLQGIATLDKVPLHVEWKQAFAETPGKVSREIDVAGAVTGNQWAQWGIDALAKTQGPIAVTLQVTQKPKRPLAFAGALDMKAAAMQIDDLGWKKPAGAPALLTLAGEMPAGKDIRIQSIDAQGPGLKIKGNAVFAAADLKPLAVNLDPFIVDRTDAALHFTQDANPPGKLSFAVEGKSFDVSGMTGGKDSDRADPRPEEYHLKLGKLYTSEQGFIANAHGNAVRDPEGWSTISFHGLADGGHQLDIDLVQKPDGHRVLAITCDDFGKALKGLGLTDTVKDGKLEISGASTIEHPRVIDGTVKIGHFQVKNLPALVVLMNATSPFGFVNLFTGTLDFDRLKGKFRWQKDSLELIDIRAPGNSVGMTIDGKLDMNSGAADLHGTIAPFSMFNRILGAIPLIGNVLTGGEGQGVLGVNYTIKGTLEKPDVGVNPVSLFTPGFLRNLFFGGSDDDTEGETPNPTPAPTKTSSPAAQKAPSPTVTNINK